MPIRAKLFICVTASIGIATFAAAMLHWRSDDVLRFGCYLLFAAMGSTLKVRLPGVEGTLSVHFLFVLLGVLELSLPETLMIGCTASLVQTIWKPRKPPRPVHVLFNLFSNTANAVSLSYIAYHALAGPLRHSQPLMLGAAACAYFLSNTMPVALIIALTERKPFRSTWTQCYFWTFPYLLGGAALVGAVGFVNRLVGWQSSILVLPVVYWIYHSYRLYLERLEEEKKRVEIEKRRVDSEKRHVEEVSALQVRTIEALAMAIEAKDHTTHSHLSRVRTYALAIADELELSSVDVEALRAAALLHDIGKLAVPDHIINKPGRLTTEEFEKMKIHPVVGAEILKKVDFPYPVAPIVRSHHEKWNGKGYPDGLRGEEIPIGARILAAVDCLDAMASDRQYRKALPLDEAMEHVTSESGISFDPTVVEILKRRYVELERLAVSNLAISVEIPTRDSPVKVEQGDKPAAGFEYSSRRWASGDVDFLSSIASAQHEAQTLFELSQDLGCSLRLDETLSLISVKLRKLIPYDSIVTFVLEGENLVPEFVSGDNFRAFSALKIPVGEGLCGWVARNSKPIINGNPGVEPGYASDKEQLIELRSALAVPLEGMSGLIGVLALYKSDADAFTSDHLRVLQAVTNKVALTVENAMRFLQSEQIATTDYLTGLPNSRALFMHLDRELARCAREKSTLAVMVCDLNGFKRINDNYGHLEGDRTLKLFGKLLRETFREYDYVARMGGDEFVVVALNLSREVAWKKASVLNDLAQQAGREICCKELTSLSVGTAFYPEDGVDAEKLLADADRKMYAIKKRYHDPFLLVPQPARVRPRSVSAH